MFTSIYKQFQIPLPKVRKSFMLEMNLTSAADQLTVMDYFFYGREKFSEEEYAFVKGECLLW